MKRIWICLFFILPPRIFSEEPQIIGDRGLFQIGQILFTQRQLMGVQLVKAVFSPEVSLKINQTTWPTILSQFQADMLVLQEAGKMKRYQSSGEDLEQGYVKWKALFEQAPHLKSFAAQYRFDEIELRKWLQQHLRITRYIENKKLSFNLSGDREFKKWLQSLEQASKVRYLDDALSYRELRLP